MCFYCDENVLSADQLHNHRTECQEKSNVLIISYPCELCGAKCTDGDDLARYITTYHELGTWCPIQEKQLFWCDVCPLYYESRIDLQFHRRGFH